MTGKICPKCAVFKARDEYFKSSKTRDGMKYACKTCSVQARAQWARQNKAKISQYDRAYYDKNTETLRQKTRDWTLANLERKAEADRTYRAENRERLKSYQAAYRVVNKALISEKKRAYRLANLPILKVKAKWRYLANPEKFRRAAADFKKKNRARYNALHAARRASKINATPKWLTAEHFAVIQFTYDLAKAASLTSGTAYQVDHYVPLRGKGFCGLHVPWNLRAVPADLNMSKGNRLPEDLIGWRNPQGVKIFD